MKKVPIPKYGLPTEVVYCKRCVMSNQRPASIPEFRHLPNRHGAKYMHIEDDGICDACRQAEKKEQIDSKMVCIGEDQTYTAMAKTVGLPVAMATLLILNGKIKTPGVQLPIREEVYLPILKELEEYGVVFKEQIVPYLGYNI